MASEEAMKKELGENFKRYLDRIAYLTILERLEGIERDLLKVKHVSVGDLQYLPLMLSRPICMAKEIAKWASVIERRNDIAPLNYLIDNEHVNEEITLLRRDMAYLKRAKMRGEF